jgi:hypothetical protein
MLSYGSFRKGNTLAFRFGVTMIFLSSARIGTLGVLHVGGEFLQPFHGPN